MSQSCFRIHVRGPSVSISSLPRASILADRLYSDNEGHRPHHPSGKALQTNNFSSGEIVIKHKKTRLAGFFSLLRYSRKYFDSILPVHKFLSPATLQRLHHGSRCPLSYRRVLLSRPQCRGQRTMGIPLRSEISMVAGSSGSIQPRCILPSKAREGRNFLFQRRSLPAGQRLFL